MLENTKNVDFYQDTVNDLYLRMERLQIKTAIGHKIKSKSVIVTAGTFLNGLFYIGEKTSVEVVQVRNHLRVLQKLSSTRLESGRMKTDLKG